MIRIAAPTYHALVGAVSTAGIQELQDGIAFVANEEIPTLAFVNVILEEVVTPLVQQRRWGIPQVKSTRSPIGGNLGPSVAICV
jgi:hypothetical protein